MTTHLLSKRLSSVATAALLTAAAALITAAGALAPSSSLAQSGDGDGDGDGDSSSGSNGKIGLSITTIDGESQDTLGDIFINLDHCQDNVEVEIEIDNIPSDKQLLDIYVGTGTNCTTTEARDGDGEADCRKLEDPIEIEGRTQDVPVTLRVNDIIQAAFGTEDCGSRSSKPSLWFLAVDNSGGTDAVSTSQYGEIELNIDTDPPDAPTSIEGGRGENEIPVSWRTGSSKVDSFEVYVDTGDGMGVITDGSVAPPPDEDDGGTDEPATVGETNDMCGSGRLRAGDSAANVASLLKKSEGSATATSTTLSAAAIGGDAAAVAVVAVDAAGNRSTLSEVACVFVVPTRGIKDLYEEKYGDFPQGCPCSAAGPAQFEGALPIALALGFIAYRRRRRS